MAIPDKKDEIKVHAANIGEMHNPNILNALTELEIQAVVIAVEADTKIRELNPEETVGFNAISIMSPSNRDYAIKVFPRKDGITVIKKSI